MTTKSTIFLQNVEFWADGGTVKRDLSGSDRVVIETDFMNLITIKFCVCHAMIKPRDSFSSCSKSFDTIRIDVEGASIIEDKSDTEVLVLEAEGGLQEEIRLYYDVTTFFNFKQAKNGKRWLRVP